MSQRDERIKALRKELRLPANVNPSLEQLRAAGIDLPRPPAPPRNYLSDTAKEAEHALFCALPSTIKAIIAVLDERHAQVHRHGRDSGWDSYYNRDDQLSLGAVAYILPPGHGHQRPHFWPWTGSTYKPAKHDPSDPLAVLRNRRADLIKGIAMALADLERVDTLLNNQPYVGPSNEEA